MLGSRAPGVPGDIPAERAKSRSRDFPGERPSTLARRVRPAPRSVSERSEGPSGYTPPGNAQNAPQPRTRFCVCGPEQNAGSNCFRHLLGLKAVNENAFSGRHQALIYRQFIQGLQGGLIADIRPQNPSPGAGLAAPTCKPGSPGQPTEQEQP